MRGLVAGLWLVTALLGGCTYYEVAPGTYVKAQPSGFDRSWNAALGAFEDQGVRVSEKDRSAGIIRGNRDGIELTATLQTRADGGVKVEFGTSGATGRDPGLIERVHAAYERGMGR